MTTTFHRNHTLPMAALALDQRFADACAWLEGAIDFSAEHAEAFAYIYDWLTADETQVRSASLRIEFPDGSKSLEDAAFPFEFTLPLPEDGQFPRLTFGWKRPDGQAERSGTVSLEAP